MKCKASNNGANRCDQARHKSVYFQQIQRSNHKDPLCVSRGYFYTVLETAFSHNHKEKQRNDISHEIHLTHTHTHNVTGGLSLE